MAVEYTEIDPSPKPEFYENQRNELHLRAKRWLRCESSNAQDVSAYLYTEVGSRYPHPPNNAYAYVRNTKWHGRGQIGGSPTLASYPETIIEVFYDSDGPRWVNGVFMEEEMIPAKFQRAIPPGKYFKENGALVSTEDWEFHRPVIVDGWHYILHYERGLGYPLVPVPYIDTVNAQVKSAYTFSLSFAIGTVLFGPPFIKSHTSFVTGKHYSFTLKHAVNVFDWNKWFNHYTGNWEPMYYKNGNRFFRHAEVW